MRPLQKQYVKEQSNKKTGVSFGKETPERVYSKTYYVTYLLFPKVYGAGMIYLV